MTSIDPLPKARPVPFPDLSRVSLGAGAHPDRGDGVCAMELVAWLAGEEHSDAPSCACPVLTGLVRTTNDLLPDDSARNRFLLPLVPRLLYSRVAARLEWRRAFVGLDVGLRELVPWLYLSLGQPELANQWQARMRVVKRAFANAEDAAAAATWLRDGRQRIGERASGLRAAIWLAARAADRRQAPTLWIGGLAHVARAIGDPRAFAIVNRAIRAMLDVRSLESGTRSRMALRPVGTKAQ